MSVLFTEALESRVLLSASPSPLNDAVLMDRLQVREDLLKFRSDLAGNHAVMLGDLIKIKADGGKSLTSLTDAVQKYRADRKTMEASLKLDRLTEKSNVLADQAAVVGDLKQMVKDRGNSTALAADRAKIITDRIKMEADMISGLNTRIATRQAFSTMLIADEQSVVNAVNADVNASDALKADVAKWSTDRAAADATITNDLSTLITDRNQLIVDLNALQTA